MTRLNEYIKGHCLLCDGNELRLRVTKTYAMLWCKTCGSSWSAPKEADVRRQRKEGGK